CSSRKGELDSTGKAGGYILWYGLLAHMSRDVAAAWLKEVDSTAIQTSLKNLKDAYDRLFRKQNKAPRFKSKNNPVQSYTTQYTNGKIANLGNKIKLPKLRFIRFAKCR